MALLIEVGSKLLLKRYWEKLLFSKSDIFFFVSLFFSGLSDLCAESTSLSYTDGSFWFSDLHLLFFLSGASDYIICLWNSSDILRWDSSTFLLVIMGSSIGKFWVFLCFLRLYLDKYGFYYSRYASFLFKKRFESSYLNHSIANVS